MLRRSLSALYGCDKANSLIKEIIAIVGNHKPGRVGGEPEINLDKQIILLAYPNNIVASGRPSLRVLNEVIARTPLNMFDTVHILPFYEATSDFGFAVRDHQRVDASLGDWSDIRRIAATRTLMADLVVHHVSASHPWFKGFLDGEPRFREFVHRLTVCSEFARLATGRRPAVTTIFNAKSGRAEVLTRFGPDQIDLNYGNPQVLLGMLRNAKTLADNGVRIFRLDAIAYAWKQPGTACAHLKGTMHLANVFRECIGRLVPDGVVVMEIDAELYGELYLDGCSSASAVGYSYGFAPSVVAACVSSNPAPLVRFLTQEVSCTRGGRTIRFLSTHDGLMLRSYRPVLSQDEIDLLVSRSNACNGSVTISGDTVYEINCPVFDLLAGPMRNDTRCLAIAIFILFSVPGIPMLYLNLLLGADAAFELMSETGEPRSINRRSVVEDDALAIFRSDHSHYPFLEALGNLVYFRQSEPLLAASVPLTRVTQVGSVIHLVRESREGKCLHAMANLDHRSKTTIALDVPARDLRSGRSAVQFDIGPLEYVWCKHD